MYARAAGHAIFVRRLLGAFATRPLASLFGNLSDHPIAGVAKQPADRTAGWLNNCLFGALAGEARKRIDIAIAPARLIIVVQSLFIWHSCPRFLMIPYHL